MKRYQVRTKFSATRTWEVEANSAKEAEEKGFARAIQYWLSKANFNKYKHSDKLRTLSVHELRADKKE